MTFEKMPQKTPARKKEPPKSRMTAAARAEFFRCLQEGNPEPRSELEYVNDYTLLVAVLLSAQSTDVGVNKATRALFAKVDTPQKMLALGEEALRQHV
jgi:endonuclease-3